MPGKDNLSQSDWDGSTKKHKQVQFLVAHLFITTAINITGLQLTQTDDKKEKMGNKNTRFCVNKWTAEFKYMLEMLFSTYSSTDEMSIRGLSCRCTVVL